MTLNGSEVPGPQMRDREAVQAARVQRHLQRYNPGSRNKPRAAHGRRGTNIPKFTFASTEQTRFVADIDDDEEARSRYAG